MSNECRDKWDSHARYRNDKLLSLCVNCKECWVFFSGATIYFLGVIINLLNEIGIRYERRGTKTHANVIDITETVPQIIRFCYEI